MRSHIFLSSTTIEDMWGAEPFFVQPIESLSKTPPPSSLYSDQALWESIWFALATSNHTLFAALLQRCRLHVLSVYLGKADDGETHRCECPDKVLKCEITAAHLHIMSYGLILEMFRDQH